MKYLSTIVLVITFVAFCPPLDSDSDNGTVVMQPAASNAEIEQLRDERLTRIAATQATTRPSPP